MASIFYKKKKRQSLANCIFKKLIAVLCNNSASIAQPAARGSHNPEVVSSNLTRGIVTALSSDNSCTIKLHSDQARLGGTFAIANIIRS